MATMTKRSTTTKKPATATPSTWKGAEGLRGLLRPIAELRPDPRNARLHPARSIAAVEKSLALFGQRLPIVVRADGLIVAGHARVESAKRLGWTEIAVVDVDGLTDDEVKAYALADNRTAELSEWDDGVLADLLREIPPLVLPDLGWSPAELRALMPPAEEPEIPEPPRAGEAVSRIGEVYMLGPHRLLCGDSTTATAWDALGDGSFVVITSPPYGTTTACLRGHLASGSDDLYMEKDDPEKWHELMRGFLRESLSRAQFTVVNVQMLADNKRALIDIIHENKSRLSDVAVWDKCSAAPNLAKGVMNSQFEFVLMFGKIDATRAIPGASSRGEFTNVIRIGHGTNDFAATHRAVFPVEFAAHLIRLCVHGDSVVLDPFGGTGTTLIAAAQEGRVARLIELSPAYCDVIRRRWARWARAAGADPGPGALD